jgi:hypothetical protein
MSRPMPGDKVDGVTITSVDIRPGQPSSGVTYRGARPDGTAVEWTELPASEVFPCPECEQGKHGNCDGTTWDDLLDQPAPCPCFCVETDDEP